MAFPFSDAGALLSRWLLGLSGIEKGLFKRHLPHPIFDEDKHCWDNEREWASTVGGSRQEIIELTKILHILCNLVGFQGK